MFYESHPGPALSTNAVAVLSGMDKRRVRKLFEHVGKERGRSGPHFSIGSAPETSTSAR